MPISFSSSIYYYSYILKILSHRINSSSYIYDIFFIFRLSYSLGVKNPRFNVNFVFETFTYISEYSKRFIILGRASVFVNVLYTHLSKLIYIIYLSCLSSSSIGKHLKTINYSSRRTKSFSSHFFFRKYHYCIIHNLRVSITN